MSRLRFCLHVFAVVCLLATAGLAGAQTFKVQIGFSETGEQPPAQGAGQVIVTRLNTAYQPKTKRLDVTGTASFELEKGEYMVFFDGDDDQRGIARFDIKRDGIYVGKMGRVKVRTVEVFFMDTKTGMPLSHPTTTLPGLKLLDESGTLHSEFPDDAKVLSYSGHYERDGYWPAPYSFSVSDLTQPTFDWLLVPLRPKSMGIELTIDVKDAAGNAIEKSSVRLIGPKGKPTTMTAGVTAPNGRTTVVAPEKGSYTLITNSPKSGISVEDLWISGNSGASTITTTAQTSTETMIYVIHFQKDSSYPIGRVSVSAPVSQGVRKTSLTNEVTVLKVPKSSKLEKFNIFSQASGHQSKRTTITIPKNSGVFYNVVIVELTKG